MRWIDRFRRDERGSQSIEFVLWVPVFVALLTIVIDATTLYDTHSEMWNVARDTARRMVTGLITSEQAAKDYAANEISVLNYPFQVDAKYDQSTGAEVTILLKVGDTSIIGFFTPLAIFGVDMRARVIMRPDPAMAPLWK